ncbi:hypothetical protein GECvBGOT_gp025c [Salmonella phage GEC_vB_GOT]|nr:hypothetical protein GECvBGOT_gp025c [Salmonella phage GEC_vB_GOT]
MGMLGLPVITTESVLALNVMTEPMRMIGRT